MDRNALHQHLLDNNIPNAIYYPVPLHLQKAYADARYKEEDFTVTNDINRNCNFITNAYRIRKRTTRFDD